MSSPGREPLSGTIRQGVKVVGAICLPEEDVQAFIDQFNHCYGPLQMKIDPPIYIATQSSKLVPVGGGFYNPFRVPVAPKTSPGL